MSELFPETAGPGITVHSTDIPSITFPEASLSSDADSNPRQTANADATQEQLWKGLSSLYDLNVTLKADAAVLDGSSKKEEPDGKQSKTDVLNDLLDTFMNGADVVLNELTILGNAHPILAVAIFAFHEVIKLDLARRDNNKKVLVVVLQMQNMLGPMFQLRNLDHQHMLETERRFHENRLKELIEVITQDIKMCRSDLTHFMNRKFVYKLVLARGYERKFAGHIETFAQRRVELQTIISEYVAVGISNANKAIHSVGTKVDVVDDKLDRIITAIFRNVDTPREKDVLKFIEQNGGPIKCVENSDLLPKLISKVGESPKTGKVAISSQAELEELQKELIEALNEDLDKVLDKHFLRFEKVLQVQSNNMKLMSAHLEDQGVLMQTHTTKLGKILDTVTTIMVLEEGKVQTKAVKLKDPEIQRVWRQMNLTSSVVKAKVFVLTFRDHIRIDNSNLPTPTPGSIPLPGSSPEDSDSLQPSAPSTQADDWVLEYIDVAYVQPIVEAIDEDGSGFISVQEANTFALARPEGMSLLHWIAYWAAGWHHNLTKYQKEIYEVLLKMNDALPNVHVTNRVYVDDYLDKRVMSRVEALLRSVRALSDMSRRDRKLVGIAEIVASRQMKQLEANLQDMGCVVESRLDATTIAGGARVETWIFPLLLLLLRRHLEIIHLSKTVVLDREEFLAHTRSLENVFAVFDERLQNLEAKFRQLHSDVDAHFLSFSYGMFNVAYKKQEFNVFDNTLMTLKADEYPHSDSTPAAPDITILSKPVGKTLDLKEVDLTPSSPPEGHIPHPTEGEWFGWFQSWTAEKPSYMRPYHCVISPVIDKKLVGKGEGFFGTIDINGSVESSTYSGPYLSVRFDLLPSNPIYLPFTCQGAYNEERDTIEGTYDYYVKPESTPQTAPPANSVVDTNPGLDASNIGEAQASNVATDDQARQVVQPNTGPTERTPDTPSQAPEIVSGSLLIEAPEIGMSEKEVVLSSQSENGATDTIGITEDKETHIPPAEEKKEDTESQSPENGDNTALSIVTVPQNHAGNGRFFLKRTPAHLFRFRRYLDGPDMPPCWKVWPIARKRWGFAIAAIVSETRARMNSRKTFNEALAERRKWLSLSMRFDQTDIDITPARYEVYESLTDKEWDAYDYLLTSVPPKIALLYEELAHYMARREIYLIPVGRAGCDVCHWNLSFTRHQCIYCMEEDMRDYVDICHNCIDKPVPAGNNIRTFSHSKSHSLMRSQHRIHIHEFNAVIPQARLISERSKKMFRDLEEQSKLKKERHHSRRSAKGKPGAQMILYGDSESGHQESNQPGLSPILCGCCNEAVTLPCWVCLICSPLTFFCVRCERSNAEVTQSNRNHSRRSHRILRIHDSIEVKSVTGKQMNDVGLQLQDLNSTMTLIDSKLNKQVEDGKEIKGIVDDVARKVGAWNDGDGTASVGPWIDEQHLEGYTGDASKVPAEAPPVEGSSEAGKNMNNALPSANPEADKSEIERRLSTLEVKVGDISTKMDGLEHKLDALFTLVQSFVESRTSPNGSA